MEKINILKNKLKTAKCNFSKSNTKAQDDFEIFRKSKDAPQKRQMRLAEEALENLSMMGEKLFGSLQQGVALVTPKKLKRMKNLKTP